MLVNCKQSDWFATDLRLIDNAHLSGGEYRNLLSETMTDVNSNLAVVTEEEILQMLTFS